MTIFRKYFEKMGFRTRMRLGTILVILLVTCVGVSVSIYRQGRDQLRALDDLGGYIAMNLSENSVLGILSEEQTNLDQPLKAVLSEDQVLGAMVYSSKGKLIGSRMDTSYSLNDFDVSEQMALVKDTGDVAVVKTHTSTGQDLRSYLAAVTIEPSDGDISSIETEQGQFGGFVRVDMLLEQLIAKKAAVLWQNLILMPIYILIGVVFSIGAEIRISRPLKNLETAALLIAQGDFSKTITVTTADEIGALAETFNNMSAELSNTINKLNLSNEELEKINNELKDFTYIVSHDLQEPLRKVHSFGQFLVEDCYNQLSEDGKDYIDRIQKASMKMKRLIQDLLKLSRVSTNEAVFTTVDTNEIIRSALDDLSVAIEECEANVVVNQLPSVTGQNTLLTQLFENIIGNALKYRNDERRPEVEVGATEQNGVVTFSIRDNGIGIEERFFEKIFGVFQRLHSNSYRGTGIGLALCKKIVKRHGGRIWVESAMGKGTTFYFTLKSAKVNQRHLNQGQNTGEY